MRSKLKVLALVAAFVPVIVLTLIFVVNLTDEPLDSKVLSRLDEPEREAPEGARRAHLYLLGLAAGERMNPERRGRELWPQTRDPAVRGALDAGGWIPKVFETCPGDVCGQSDLTPSNLNLLESSRAFVGLYNGLMEFEDYAFAEPVLMIPDPRAHRLFTLALARWLDVGGEVRAWHALEVSNRFFSRVLVTGPLLARRIALENLLANARFAARAREDHPKLPLPPTVAESITLADPTTILGGAWPWELRATSRAVEDLRRGPGRIGLRPNETLNRHHDLFNQILFTDCPVIDRSCVPALGYLGFGTPGHWIVNPVGRYLATAFGENLGGRRLVEAHLREIARLKRGLAVVGN